MKMKKKKELIRKTKERKIHQTRRRNKVLRGYAENQKTKHLNSKRKFLIHLLIIQKHFSNNFQKLRKTKKKFKKGIKNYGVGMEQKMHIRSF